MTNLRLKLFAAGACAVLMATATYAAHPGSNAKLLKQIQETIAKIQAMKGSPSVASVPTPTPAHKITNSWAKSVTPNPIWITSALATTPPRWAAS